MPYSETPRADCYAFEDEIRELVEAFGYPAETTKAAGDGGVDVVGRRGVRKVVVQCKLYAKGKIGGPVVKRWDARPITVSSCQIPECRDSTPCSRERAFA